MKYHPFVFVVVLVVSLLDCVHGDMTNITLGQVLNASETLSVQNPTWMGCRAMGSAFRLPSEETIYMIDYCKFEDQNNLLNNLLFKEFIVLWANTTFTTAQQDPVNRVVYYYVQPMKSASNLVFYTVSIRILPQL